MTGRRASSCRVPQSTPAERSGGGRWERSLAEHSGGGRWQSTPPAPAPSVLPRGALGAISASFSPRKKNLPPQLYPPASAASERCQRTLPAPPGPPGGALWRRSLAALAGSARWQLALAATSGGSHWRPPRAGFRSPLPLPSPPSVRRRWRLRRGLAPNRSSSMDSPKTRPPSSFRSGRGFFASRHPMPRSASRIAVTRKWCTQPVTSVWWSVWPLRSHFGGRR